MKWFRQFGIILCITLAAELLEKSLPLPVPASIYGLLLMLGGLISKIIPLKNVERAADFLIEVMPVMFIPAAVGILDSYDILQEILIPFTILLFVTTIVVMAVTGRAAQWLIRKEKEKNSE